VTSAVFDAAAAASQVVTALLPQADSERAGQAKRYLKSDLDFLGVSVPAIRSAGPTSTRSPAISRAPIALVHPDAWPLIDAWAADEDFWVRRSALLTLLPGIRRGRLDHERFERYATPMLAEKEFFIRKAIGWVLREAAKKDPAYVAAWTRGHLDQMSGVTFREAVRRLPAEQAAPLQAAYRRRQGHASA
jgi:hypothetical protein